MGIGFAHLHVHNEYSQLDGMGTATQYAERAKELGFESLALTNHGNVDGLIQFQRACDKVGVNPIAGCELYVVPDRHRKEKGEKRGHATVLVKNHAGFENLMQMLTVANLEGFYYKPRVDYETMLKHLEGLVLLTGCSDSFLFSHKPDNGKLDDMFLDLIRKEDTYVEIMPHDIEQERRVVEWWLKNGVSPVPFVATNDCHYVMEDDWESQEVLLAMQRKAKWSDKDRWRFNIKGLHLRSAEEMFQAFRAQGILDNWQIRDAMERTVEVAEKCAGFRIEKQRMFLPTPPDYVGKDANEELWRLCEVACEGRPEAYWDRLNEEMDLIEGKGFSRYFLIVYELANWCRRNDVMVGPGRGSVGGSLMAYLLGITTVDPLRFDLLFSRFISQDRIDYPDIDLDFEDRKRHLVIQHLEDLYGRNNVANIATFLRMKAKMVVRDVARVFEIPLKDVDEFAKSIEDGDAHDTDRISRFVKSKEGRGFARKYPDVVRHASRLEGQVRGYGTHAAGIIVSGEDLRGGTKCNLISPSGNVSINWEMGDSEYMGLMKLDILGLNTLSVLSECRRLILENHGDQLATHPESDCCFVCRKENLTDQVEYLGEFDFPNLPLDDPKVYKELSAGNTHGTFQFTGYACTELIKRMCVSNFEDLVQAISLARPGPADSGMTDLFVKRKHGEKWSRKHDTFEDVTKDTYGVVVYQEQVMNVIHKVAGLPYETADKIRKVIGKKRDAKEFAPFKEAFIQGCRKQKTFTDQEAEDFWVELQNHAHYSFNRSHAVEYAMIGYWTAWVKFRYPTEFLCASLTYEGDSKKPGLVKEAYRLGLQVVPPKVGISDAIKWIARGNRLYVPFKEVKGIGEKTALQAVEIK
ncbi:MAG: DNA polymerase III subunit alpha, partial [Gammaproteobacteria bacterium]|nr:DNA polymerase III subunit alpha [Gammaproteobacteria bacterium]